MKKQHIANFCKININDKNFLDFNNNSKSIEKALLKFTLIKLNLIDKTISTISFLSLVIKLQNNMQNEI